MIQHKHLRNHSEKIITAIHQIHPFNNRIELMNNNSEALNRYTHNAAHIKVTSTVGCKSITSYFYCAAVFIEWDDYNTKFYVSIRSEIVDSLTESEYYLIALLLYFSAQISIPPNKECKTPVYRRAGRTPVPSSSVCRWFSRRITL